MPMNTAQNSAQALRYVWVEIQAECPKCGDPVPVNGLQTNVVCDNCNHEFPVSTETWLTLLSHPDNAYNELAYGEQSTASMWGTVTKVTYGLMSQPTCPTCHAALPPDHTQVGTQGSISCPSCGATIPTFPAPDWLTAMLPSCRQVYGIDPPHDGKATADVKLDEQADKPIAMACPQCGAGLTFTSAEQRLVPCTYCGADVYLPDAIWKRLHPVTIKSRWFFRFEGPSEKAVTKQQKQSRKRAEEWAEQDKRLEALAAEPPPKEETSNWLLQVFIAFVIIVSIFVFLFSFLSK